MKKIINTTLRILLAILLIIPILGSFGIFPSPTREMYSTDKAFDFVLLLMESGYIMWMMSAVFLICLILIYKNKMAIVALLLLPITLNIAGFHMFFDGGLFTAGAIMGNVLFLVTIYFLYQNQEKYKTLY